MAEDVYIIGTGMIEYPTKLQALILKTFGYPQAYASGMTMKLY